MFARVLPLRLKGALLDLNPNKVVGNESALVSGFLQWGAPLHSKGSCLMLRHPMAPPSMGVCLTLYEPRLTDIGHSFIKLRGFEPGEDGGRSAGYLQEWALYPATVSAQPSSMAT